VAAALIAALIETLGCVVKFAAVPEVVEDSVRRWRPKICLVDCVDPAFCNGATVGRAQMRGIPVIVFGTSSALDRVGALVVEHAIDTLRMPADARVFDDALQRALRKPG
jgi:DNA-binding NtrC family response regulator